VSAVGQDLALQLVHQAPRRRLEQPLLAGHAQSRGRERDDALEARQPVPRVACRPPQVAHLSGEAAQESAVEAGIGIVQDERCLAQPRNDAARHHLRPPGD
jgi:hypothetical protein